MNATEIADCLLETEHDAHVKAFDRVGKWDGAHARMGELMKLRQQADDLFVQSAKAVSYNRALAHVGLSREDVDHPIYVGSILAIDNFKGKENAKKCSNSRCTIFHRYDARPVVDGGCPNCGEPMDIVEVPISPSRLRGHYAKHMFGVKTRDGRKVWFKEPVSPKV